MEVLFWIRHSWYVHVHTDISHYKDVAAILTWCILCEQHILVGPRPPFFTTVFCIRVKYKQRQCIKIQSFSCISFTTQHNWQPDLLRHWPHTASLFGCKVLITTVKKAWGTYWSFLSILHYLTLCETTSHCYAPTFDLFMQSRLALMVSHFLLEKSCDKGTQQEQLVFSFAKEQEKSQELFRLRFFTVTRDVHTTACGNNRQLLI